MIRARHPQSPGSCFEPDGTFMCRGDDGGVYRVVRRQPWIVVTGLDGLDRWQRADFCNYALDDGRPVAPLTDGRLVVAPISLVLAPL